MTIEIEKIENETIILGDYVYDVVFTAYCYPSVEDRSSLPQEEDQA